MKGQCIGCGYEYMCSWRGKDQRTLQQDDGVFNLLQETRDQHDVKRTKLTCRLICCRIPAVALNHTQSRLSNCKRSCLFCISGHRFNHHPALEVNPSANCSVNQQLRATTDF